MALPVNNAKVTMVFDLKGPSAVNDEAQFGAWGIWSTPPAAGSATDAALLLLAEKARDHWVADVDKSSYSSAVELKTVIATQYNASGHTLNEQRAVTTSGDWVGAQTRSLPWECSMVVSLYSYTPGTFIPNARRRRGRCYLPPIGAGILANNSSGQLADADALAFGQEFHDWLHAVSDEDLGSGLHWDPVVMSQMDAHGYLLTDIVVDGKIDSQRRREKQQPSVRQTISY
jgi:hypothetical protein